MERHIRRKMAAILLSLGIALGGSLALAGPASATSAAEAYCIPNAFGTDTHILIGLSKPPFSMDGYTYETWHYQWNSSLSQWQWAFDNRDVAYQKVYASQGIWYDGYQSMPDISYYDSSVSYNIVFARLTAPNGYMLQDWISPYEYDNGADWAWCQA